MGQADLTAHPRVTRIPPAVERKHIAAEPIAGPPGRRGETCLSGCCGHRMAKRASFRWRSGMSSIGV
jgi:hypothetical protein